MLKNEKRQLREIYAGSMDPACTQGREGAYPGKEQEEGDIRFVLEPPASGRKQLAQIHARHRDPVWSGGHGRCGVGMEGQSLEDTHKRIQKEMQQSEDEYASDFISYVLLGEK